MRIINLHINKIIIHQIFQRDADGNKITPDKSTEFIRFDEDGTRTFRTRVLDALGENSKAVQMAIVNQENTDLAPMIERLVEADSSDSTDDYVQTSYDIANKLADAQARKSIPGGIVVVFSGKYGASPKNFVGVMKAEIYSAYEKLKNEDTQEITLKFVEEALLTPATKLYKTAGFFETGDLGDSGDLNSKWDVLVSDSQISQTDGKAAARYFYADFLGCGYPESKARTTKLFYDATCEFIQDLDVSEEKRSGIKNALVSYLKHENSDSIVPAEFASRHFGEEERNSFSTFLEEKDLPTNAFVKDTEYIESKLKIRRLSFSKQVKISAPSQVFQDLVEIETITEDDEGNTVDWTKIIVKDNIVSQE